MPPQEGEVNRVKYAYESRAGRVVAETLSCMGRQLFSSNRLTMLVLPAPEGPEIITNRPADISIRSPIINHSTFCTISRKRSITDLISTTYRAISESFAFDPIVLVSRNIS